MLLEDASTFVVLRWNQSDNQQSVDQSTPKKSIKTLKVKSLLF